MPERRGETWPPARFRLRSSHNNLLVNCYDRQDPLPLDAIIVPSHRTADHVDAAAGLAKNLNCHLIVLSNQNSSVAEVAGRMSAPGGVAVRVTPWALNGPLKLTTMMWAPGRSPAFVDRSLKRNIGLLVARMLDWTRVLFLDDDIPNLDSHAVQGAVGNVRVDGPRVAGWRARHYPDNSVVCHALRASGELQDVFVAGGALLVHLRGRLPFYPAVYNEDWLFMHDFIITSQVGWVDDVDQLAYHPFDDPERASREEFGDILAEGLMALVHEGRSVLVACLPSYWPEVMHERRYMLRHIERRLWRRRQEGHATTADGHEIIRVLRSIEAARETLNGITPDNLAEFTSAWRHDLYLWNSRLAQLPRFGQIEEALNWLGLRDIHYANPA